MRIGLEKLFALIQNHLGLNVTKIHPRVTRKLYRAGATVRNCDGSCCRNGTTLSVKERDAILKHRRIVKAHMTSWARNHTDRWFTKRIMRDNDFTQGLTVTTTVIGGTCVFLRKDSLCALQVAGDKELHDPYALKPAVCLLWPLCIHNQTLDVGLASYTKHRDCCAPMRQGTRTVLQVMSPDERLLRRMARPANSRSGGPPARRA
ncbi:MAG: DUF3109 family protein [Acidobacteriota bacterium]